MERSLAKASLSAEVRTDTTSLSSAGVKRNDCSGTIMKGFGAEHAARLEDYFMKTTFLDFMVRRFDLAIVEVIVCTRVALDVFNRP